MQVLETCEVVWFFNCSFFDFDACSIGGCAGKKLAESIVKEKLAACVNRVPGENFSPPNFVYLWFKISNIWEEFGVMVLL